MLLLLRSLNFEMKGKIVKILFKSKVNYVFVKK